MQNANTSDAKNDIANRFKIIFPCIEQLLDTRNPVAEITTVQFRLLTYKELLLHSHSLTKAEVDKGFNSLTPEEKKIAQLGVLHINKAILEIDELLAGLATRTL
ncbi:hypothetical protein KI743_02540 [Vibrio sp. D420a]|uniref:hypothetical protein n=1 Tax=Vibrio sp. D420a TaxID=2836895 RepID=UPI002557203F|nr:hypothetical protein [Vibrio sp. D420a]MDK9760871.1 hypothetical protein [Vibrio sp. D420a]